MCTVVSSIMASNCSAHGFLAVSRAPSFSPLQHGGHKTCIRRYSFPRTMMQLSTVKTHGVGLKKQRVRVGFVDVQVDGEVCPSTSRYREPGSFFQVSLVTRSFKPTRSSQIRAKANSIHQNRCRQLWCTLYSYGM